MKPNRVFTRDIAINFNEELLPIIQNLTACGFQPNEIGQIVGFAGELSKNWIKSLMKGREDVAEAVKTGRILAQSAVLARLIQAALGYTYEEIDEYWEATDRIKSNGQSVWVKKRETIHKRHSPANMQAMIALATKLMPETFQNAKESLPETTDEQLKRLGGKLINEISRQSTGLLENNTEANTRESTVSSGAGQTITEGQSIPESNETVDSDCSSNSL